MGSILLPGDWTRQPSFVTGVNRGRPLARGLCEALYPTRHDLTNANSAQIVGVNDGLAFKGGGTAYFIKTYSGPPITTAGTILAVVQGAAGNGLVSVSLGKSTDNNPIIALQSTSANYGSFWTRTFSTGATISDTKIAFEATKRHVLLGVFDDSGMRLYVDGVIAATSATVVDYTSQPLNLLAIGALARATPASISPSSCALAAVWNRSLTDAEVIEVSRNPWQIFQPLPRTIFAPAAGGTSVTADGALPSVSLTAATGSATGAATASGSLAAASLTAPAGNAMSSATTSGSLQAISLSAPTGSAATAGSAAADGALTVIGLTAPDATATVSIQAQAALAAIFLTPAEGSATGSSVCDGSFAPISLTACRASASNGLESAEALRKSVFLKISHPSYVIRV